MLKRAYEIGVGKACAEAGIAKEAFLGQALTKGLSMMGSRLPGGARALEWGMRNPLAARTLAGAGVGGLGGAAFGDEGGFARGALLGAGVGAGAGLGRQYGLGRGGQAAERLLGDVWRGAARGPRLERRAAMAQRILGQRAPQAAQMAAGGAAAGGLAGLGLGQAAIPGGEPPPPPWYRFGM